MDDIGAKSSTAEPMRAVWVMQKLYFQREQAVFAKIHRVDWHFFFKIPDV